ncbi:unnamed protein product, partial [marine sediment metagenome]
MSISEQQLASWSSVPSATEKDKMKNTHEEIRAALSKEFPISDILSRYNQAKEDGLAAYEVYLQGSYANNTYIRFNSDIDIVMQFNCAWGK